MCTLSSTTHATNNKQNSENSDDEKTKEMLVVQRKLEELYSSHDFRNYVKVDLFRRLWDGEAKRVVLSGFPGAGKTTLLARMAYEWANGWLWRDKFDVVVVLTAGQTLEQKLLLSCSLPERTVAEFAVWAKNNCERVLWLLDGWNEVKEEHMRFAIAAIG